MRRRSRSSLAACDLMDRRILSLAREIDARYARAIPREAEAMLLVEQQADDEREVLDELAAGGRFSWQRKRRLAFAFHMALAPDEFDAVSAAGPARCADALPPARHRAAAAVRRGHRRAARGAARLSGAAAERAQAAPGHGVALRPRRPRAVAHPAVSRPGRSGRRRARCRRWPTSCTTKCCKVGGTISGEHGDGLSRTPFLRQQYGPLYDVFREVKRIFDPHNMLNPGKIVADVPQPLTQNLRHVSAEWDGLEQPGGSGRDDCAEPAGELPADVKPLELHLIWDGKLSAEAAACNGCGRCRSQSPDARMCPIFRFAPREEASPRAKANLMRGVLSGQLPPDDADQRRAARQSPTCASTATVPAGVPGGRRHSQADDRGQGPVRRDQRPGHDRLAADAARLARRAGRRDSPARQLGAGTRGGRAGCWKRRSASPRAASCRGCAGELSAPGRAPPADSAAAAHRRQGAVLRRHVRQLVRLAAGRGAGRRAGAQRHRRLRAPDQQPSGMPRSRWAPSSRPAMAAAQNVALLAEAVRQGYEIVSTEPSAALCLTHEYPTLLDDDDARLVAAAHARGLHLPVAAASKRAS